MKATWFLIAFFATCSVGVCQGTIYAVADGKTITDPATMLSNIAFLSEESVAKELRLDASQIQEINALLRETRGLPSTVVFKSPLPPIETRRSLQVAILQERENRIKDILDPVQRDRLQQVIYQIEIARAGLGNAIIDGFLGRDIGIEDFEKNGLRIIFDALQLEVSNAKSKLIASIHQDVLEQLAEQQRQLFPIVIGKQFLFQENPEERIRRTHNEKKELTRRIPNPESLFEVCVFLETGSVVDELNASLDQIKQVRIQRKQGLRSDSDSLAFQSAVSSIMKRDQITRLKQIGYQWEVSKIGLGTAIGKGFLGKALGLSEAERQGLQKALNAIDENAEKSLIVLETAARDRFVAELTPQQREQGSKLLGKPFSYRE